MGMTILSQLAKAKTVCYLKRINRKIKIQEETIYIAQRELAVTEQLGKIPRLVLVEHCSYE